MSVYHNIKYATVEIRSSQDDSLLGNGVIITDDFKIATSGEVLRKLKKPLSAIEKEDHRFIIVVYGRYLEENKSAELRRYRAKIEKIYSGKAPFEVVVLKIDNEIPKEKNGDIARMNLSSLRSIPLEDRSFHSYTRVNAYQSSGAFKGTIKDTDQLENERFDVRFEVKRDLGGLNESHIGCGIYNHKIGRLVGIIINIEKSGEYEYKAICCNAEIFYWKFDMQVKDIDPALIEEAEEIRKKEEEQKGKSFLRRMIRNKYFYLIIFIIALIGGYCIGGFLWAFISPLIFTLLGNILSKYIIDLRSKN